MPQFAQSSPGHNWRELRSHLPPNLCLSTFQVDTAFLEICTTIEPWSVFHIPLQSDHLLPVCCCWRGHATCQLFCTNTRCLLCQWQENWQLLPMLYTEWFRQGSRSVPQVVVPSCPIFPIFLFSTMSSVLSRTSSLLSLEMGFSKMSSWMLLFRG